MKNTFINILIDKASQSTYKNDPKNRLSAKNAFTKTEAELKRLNTLIRSRKLSDEHIGNTIFTNLRGEIAKHEIENYVKDHFTAAYYSFIDLREKMIKENIYDYRGIKKYGYLITLILFDIKKYADHIGRKINKDYYFFKGGKTNIEDSRWHYLGTFQLIYNSIFDKKMLDDKFALILSPVSLRQTIELKMQRVLGIAEYFDLNGKKIFTHHFFFFEFIKKNKLHFELDFINLKIIQKVFEFCNNSVHKGVMPYYWQMFYAIKFCDSLFYDPDYQKRKNKHIHSALRIKNYNELKIKLKNELTKKFPKPEFELFINWITPEAQLLS